ncbi:MAG: alpha-1,4-glucan--maltose-1-phosphate maltosyltransferase [Chloroflexi bacterium]|nr:alpha-1,4-glucan--maltose-1-phosphate maltosyltransferase [Chloroflexota bacterium]MBV9895952.1 alpha-1,4-glucan--maltose-1-phosphate maltosyltransferase [Chloroflexota bacterium]
MPTTRSALPSLETYPAIAIEDVQPEIDGGHWPIKRVVGDEIQVSADIFKEGHDLLQARVVFRALDEPDWREEPMQPTDNDRWVGAFRVDRNTRHVYSVLAFTDVYGSWRADLQKRLAAAQDVTSELLEGLRLLDQAASRCTDPDDRGRLEAYARRWRASTYRDQAELAISQELGAIVDRWPDRGDATRYRHELQLIVDRPAARFAAWYEIFPRSQGTDPNRSATFREAEARLPAIAAMGFDTLYMTPIHPIGTTNRKGPNNTLVAGPHDPGSPYATGSAVGGHEAVAPELGTLEDFLHFQQTAKEHGLELVLDFAIQVSPDHPWVKEHPQWFYHRPDGSIKFAENPPKKYEDIYPLNFRSPDWKNLWAAWRDIILLWAERGVRVFRVDNPHTKPLAFWEWMIREVQDAYPDVIFLAEAFTRPKMMRALAKVGFSQSYTYFTWRNTRSELQDYLIELTQGPMKEYYRGNFFANTPDILPPILQLGGRPAFRMRLVLAATLSSVYGIYNGFELCENTPRGVPGVQEYYQDSEMYQHKVWDWDRPGNIVEDVARINRIRRDNPALHLYDNLRFSASDNDQLLVYNKASRDGTNVIVCVVNLDPHWPQSGWVEVPTHQWGMPADQPYVVHDLLSDERYTWRGNWNWVRLDPSVRPAHILRVERANG